MISTSLKGNFH